MTTTTDDKSIPAPKPKRPRPRGATIIHVEFGEGGGRRRGPEPSPLPVTENGAMDESRSREPVTDLFSPREVERLLGLNAARLRSLDKASIVSPTGRKRG